MLVRVQKTPHVAEKEQVRPTMFTMFDCKVQWNPTKQDQIGLDRSAS